MNIGAIVKIQKSNYEKRLVKIQQKRSIYGTSFICCFDLKPSLHDITCCQTGCQTAWQPGKCLYTRYNRLSNPLSNR